MTKPIRLSIVFSFRNEEEVLPELVKRCRSVLSEEQGKGVLSGHELVFVNDASDDNSVAVLQDLSKSHTDIKIINMSRVFHVTPCVLAGLEHATGDAAIYMDSDLQDPPEIIPQLLETYFSEENVDVVHTVRRKRKGDTLIKKAITAVGYFILNRFTDVPIPREAGDFKLLSRRVIDHLVKFKEQRPFMRGLVSWVGFNHKFVEYERDVRFAGKTKFTMLNPKVYGNFLHSGFISYASAPLKLASYLGLTALFFVFILLAHAVMEKLAGKAIPGWTAIMIAVLFMGGVQLFCLGIIGLYINAIFEDSKGRPNYIVESVEDHTGDLGSTLPSQETSKRLQTKETG